MLSKKDKKVLSQLESAQDTIDSLYCDLYSAMETLQTVRLELVKVRDLVKVKEKE